MADRPYPPGAWQVQLGPVSDFFFSPLSSNSFYILGNVVHGIIFGIMRSALPLTIALPFVRRLLYPFTAHFLRGPWTLVLPIRQWSIIFQTLHIGLTTVACWNNVFDGPFLLNEWDCAYSNRFDDPIPILLSGVASSNKWMQYCAYDELSVRIEGNSNSARACRLRLFAGIKHNHSLWQFLVQATLQLLREDREILLRRGMPISQSIDTPNVGELSDSSAVRLLKMLRELKKERLYVALLGPYTHWIRPLVHKKVEMALPNRYTDIKAVTVLCTLMRDSREQELQGVIQRDMSAIIEVMVLFLLEIEAFRNEINENPRSTAEAELRSGLKRLPVEESIGLARQVIFGFEMEFANKMLDQLSITYKEKLQQIVAMLQRNSMLSAETIRNLKETVIRKTYQVIAKSVRVLVESTVPAERPTIPTLPAFKPANNNAQAAFKIFHVSPTKRQKML
ncbi:hypothetical protein WOLCODRAFT_162566 [Wolfiporia cocos MD-104 SS10]|uniref:Uncharacterized protein n=1 Tax=Wolfiporia cocos (strain MD-104) TaxID=742152 RepID=A0A2H3JF32_WOLCO|nr:hypothetical protein WOLCODRAFT_162566 [Wolfiporia cocos MD-104 SS10]